MLGEREPVELTPERLREFVNQQTDLLQHAIIDAVAGAGKSYSMSQALELVPPGSRILVMAFNNSSVDDFERDVLAKLVRKDITVEASTFHSYALKFLPVDRNRVIDKAWKFQSLRARAGRSSEEYQILLAAVDLMGKIQNTLTDASNDASVTQLMEDYNIGMLLTETQRKDAIIRAQDEMHSLDVGIRRGRLPNKIDHDDMLWLPVQCNLPVPPAQCNYNWIFLDECQDFSPVQLRLLEKVLMAAPSLRVFAAGDPRQSIYGFRCARDTMTTLRQLLSRNTPAIAFTLPVCRRCPTKHVALARLVVPHIAPLPGREEGQLAFVKLVDVLQDIAGGDVVLCRAAPPLVQMAFDYVRKGRPARIAGEGSLKKSLRAFFVHTKSTGADPTKAAKAAFGKIRKELLSTGTPRRIRFYTDFYGTIEFLASQCKDADGALKFINDTFRNKPAVAHEVSFSTIHRAKGITTQRVWLLVAAEQNLETNPRMADFDEEELNLWYVGCTRAREALHIVECPTDVLPAEVQIEGQPARDPRATTVPVEILQHLLPPPGQ